MQKNKDELKEKSKQKTITDQTKNVSEYQKDLIKFMQDSKNELLSSDVDELKKEQKMLQKVRSRGTQRLDVEFEDLADEFSNDLGKDLKDRLKGFFKEAKKKAQEAEDKKTRSYEVSTSRWYNPFSWGSSRTEYETITIVRTSEVKSALKDLEDNLQGTLDEIYSQKLASFKNDVTNKRLLPSLRAEIEKAGGDDELIDPLKWRKVTKSVIDGMPEPELTCKCDMPSGSGTLERWEAEEFLESATKAADELQDKVKDEIKDICKEIKKVAKEFGIGERIFGEFDERIQNLVNDLDNRQQSLETYDSIISELQKVGE